MHENRETSGAPRPERERGRSAKAQSHTADAHALEESDRAILPMSQTNKEERSSAEPGEKRSRAKENIVQSDTSPTQCGEMSVPRIVRCASSSIARQSSKVGTVCGSAARTVLCGGRSVMIVPTATLGRSHLTRHMLACLCKRGRGQSRFRGWLWPTLTHVRRLAATARRKVCRKVYQ